MDSFSPTSTPFASRLNTNYATNEDEVVQLTAILASLQQELDLINARFEEIQQQRALLQRAVEDHRALMAPVRRLPVDVVQEIFRHCLPQTHGAFICAQECPLLLTQICSGWRAIALKTPTLWASIHVPIPEEDFHIAREYYRPQTSHRLLAIEVARRRARMVTEWLGRSGLCTLDITLHGRWGSKPSDTHNIILDALLPFADRWGTLVCDAPPASLGRIAALPARAFPRLHILKIYGGSASWLESGVLSAQLLTNVAYSQISEDFTQFPLRFSQLTNLSLHIVAAGWHIFSTSYISISKLGGLLSQCPLLQSCRLDVVGLPTTGSEAPNNDIPTLIPLPHLTQFEIRIHSERLDVSPLFNALDVPKLEDLEFHTLETVPFLSFLPRIAHTLCVLTLDPRLYSRNEFAVCMRACTELVSLRLSRSNYMPGRFVPQRAASTLVQNDAVVVLKDEFLELLSPPERDSRETTQVLLPKLSTFECILPSEFSDFGVLAFLRTRLGRLKTVRIAFARSQELPMKSELEMLAHHGIRCQLSYLPSSKKNTRFLASEGITLECSTAAIF